MHAGVPGKHVVHPDVLHHDWILIDVRVFLATITDNFGLLLSIVGGLIAAMMAQRIFVYTRNEGLLMASLSLPQVAATLVAYEARNSEGVRLVDEPIVNTVIVLMVVTSILGPTLTELFGKRLVLASKSEGSKLRIPVLSDQKA